MTYKTRRIVFFLFIVLFLILGAAITAYSFGWRMNFNNFNFQKVGAIALETSPRGVNIKLNGKPIADDSGLIQKHTLISGLLPKTYQISVEKNGYLPYLKTLEVWPSLVSEALNIILIPEKIIPQTLFPNLRGQRLAGAGTDNKFIVKNAETAVNYLYSPASSAAFNINASFANLRKNPPLEIKFHPFESKQLLIETRGGINIFDTDKLKAEAIIAEPVQAWDAKNSAVYFVQNKEIFDSQTKTTSTSPFLFSFNLIFKNQNTLLEIKDRQVSLPVKKLAAASSGNKFAFLDSSGKLFLFDQTRNTFEKISDNAKFFEFSPASDAIAFLDFDGKITVRFLEDWHVSIRKLPGEEIYLEPADGKNIEAFSWHKDSFHLFLRYAGRLDFIELDTRSAPNVYNLVSGLNDFIYSPSNDKIYFIKNSTLQALDLNAE